MQFTRKAKVVTSVPTASMADIAFLLLVFFMVSTVFVRFRGLPVDMPTALEIEKLNRRHVTSIWIDGQGAINIDDQNIALDQVGKIIHSKLTVNPRMVISIKSDGEAQFGLVSDLLQELRKVDALRVNFSTRREMEE
ncbi:MAG: hypothetical protein GKR89_08360 [Candidatus Latescibacteria bacterium]|nr:hypothetical protein [Candidatus Latescibacterota bacterium]